MTDKIFDQLHHVCIVVENMDRAVTFYESIGIGRGTNSRRWKRSAMNSRRLMPTTS